MEHAWSDKNSTIKTHIDNCEGINHINSINRIFLDTLVDNRNAHISLVQSCVSIIDRSDHWNVLLLKEALCIKQLKPVLNYGLMALKELELFA